MTAPASPMWTADGRTADGYAVHAWPRSSKQGLVVRVTYPAGGRFLAVAAHAVDGADAARWAEAEIQAERAQRVGGAS